MKYILYTTLIIFGFNLNLQAQATWTATGCSASDPTVSKVFVDACYDPEGYNEFVYMQTGSSAWNWSNLNIIGSGINFNGTSPSTGAPMCSPVATVFSSNPTIVAQLNAGVGPCPTPVFYAAPNPIPANSAIMITMSSVGISGVSPGNISALCGKGPVYVISGNYTSAGGGGFGFFKNGTGGSGCPSSGSGCGGGPSATFPGCNATATFNFGNGCVKTVTYNLNAFPNQDGANILASGAYNVSGCFDAPPCPAPPAPTMTPSNLIFCAGQTSIPNGQSFACSNCGANGGSYNVFTTATGGVPVFIGTNFPTNYNIAGLPTGTTTFYVGQTGFCESARVPITITKSDGPSLAVSKVDANCAVGPGSGTATVVPTGTNPYTYLWSNTPASTQPTATGLSPGTYNVTVTDGNGCTKVSNVTVGSPPDITTSVSATTAATCVTPGTATVAATGGTPTFTYNWGSQTGATYSNLTPGNYTVTVTDSKGCTKTQQATITANTSVPIAVATAANPLTCTTTSIGISGVGSSSGGYTYNWSGPGIVSGGTTLTPTVNQIGSYTITVTNTVDGCTKTASVTVNEDKTQPTTNIATPPKITCSTTSVQINAAGTSTGANFTYNWSGPGIVSGGTTLTPTVNLVGTYTITVTNATNGCTKVQSITVDEDKTPPTVSAGPNKTLNCANNQSVSITATGSAGSTYSWSNGGSNATTTITTPGVYTVTATNPANGCKSTSSVTVTTDITPPTIDPINNVTITCANPSPSVSVNATGSNLTYNWTSGGSGSTSTVSNPGFYTVVVTNGSNGCTASQGFTAVEDKVLPTAVLAPPLQLNCATGGSILLDPTGSSSGASYNYLWSGPGGILGFQQTPLTVTTPGTYTLAVAGANGCVKLASVTVIGNVTPPTGSAGPNQTLNCLNNGTVSIGSAGSGNQSYIWSNGSTSNIQTPITTPGTYTLTITNNDNGCTKVTSVTIDADNTPPTISPIAPVTVNCYTPNPSLNVSATGSNLSYNWSPSGSGANPTVTLGGTYTVTVTNGTNGCKSTSSVTVDYDKTDPTAVIANPPILSCYNNSNITLDPSGTSTGANFNYNWSGPGLSSTNLIPPNVTAPGTYILTVTNSTNGCTKIASVTITQNNALPNAVAGSPQTLNCYNNGSLLIGGASSSGANFTYLWNNGNTSATQTVTSPGTYTITVTNTDNGCTKEASVTIAEDKTNPTVNAGTDLFINCYTPTVSPSATASGGTLLTYAWAGPGITAGGTSLTPTINLAGTYTITVTNTTNGCKSVDDVVVTSDVVLPTAVATVSNAIDCNNPTAIINATGSSSGANFSYLWSGPNSFSNTNIDPTVTAGGAYTVTVTNSTNGCTKAATINVVEDKTPPSANAGGTQSVTCTNPTIQLNATGSTGANFAYNWTTTGGNIITGSSSLTPTINAAGTYFLTVTNNTTGCTATSQAVVNEDKVFPVANATGGGLITCYAPTLSLGVNVTSGSNLQFQWAASAGGNIVGNANQQNITVNQGGTYNVTITNAVNGCSVTSVANTTADNTNPTANATASGTIDCNNPSAILDGSSSSQGANFTFNWTGPSFNNSSTLQPTVTAGGAYTLSITNTANGCTATKTIVVNEDKTLPNATITNPAQLNCINPTVTIQAAGTATNLYNWTTSNGNIVSGTSTLSPVVNQAGTYTLNVVNPQTGCQATYSTTIISNIAYPTVTLSQPGAITCANPIAQINAFGSSAAGNFLLEWSANPGAIQSGLGSLSITTSTAGIYTLKITDNTNGCTKSASVTVVDDRVYPLAVVNTSLNQINCSIKDITLEGTGSTTGGATSYNWLTSNGGNIISGGTTLYPKVNSGGTYTLIVTNNANNCTATKSIDISQNTTPPTVNAGPAKVITCSTNSVQLQGSGSNNGFFLYQWYNAGGNIPNSSGGNTFTPTVSQVGTYYFVITDGATGCKDTAQTTVTLDLGVPVANAGTKKEVSCNVSSVQLDGTGSSNGAGFTFNWTTTNGNFISGQNTLTPTVNKAGLYKLEVTNTANGCKGNAQVQVDDNTIKPTLKIAKPTILNCANTLQTLNGAGSSAGTNFVYTWTTTNGNIVSGASTLSPEIDKAGIYKLNIQNTQNGCFKDSSITIVDNFNKPNPAAAPTSILTCVQPTQILDASASTNIQNAKITWTSTVPNSIVSGANTLTPTINEEADYKLILTDTLSQCKDSIVFSVKKDANIPTANAGATAELNCTNKTLKLNGTASSSPTITYLWTTTNGNILSGATTLKPDVDKAGKYTLKVVDSANQCIKESSVDITQDTVKPIVTIVKPAILNCKNAVMALDASASSQGADFKLNWNFPSPPVSGNTTLTPLINKPGNYVLTISNTKNTCVTSNAVTVLQDIVKPQATIAPTDTLNCINLDLKLKGTASANSTFYTFEWKTPVNAIVKDGTTLSPTIKEPGNYQLVVTDTVNYCATTAQITVIKDVQTPIADAGQGGNLTCTLKSITLSATATNGNAANFIYTWTTPDGNIVGATNKSIADADAPGKYFFEVENKVNGCKSIDSTNVTQDANVPIVSIVSNGTLNCKTNTLILDGTGSSQGAGISFTWKTKNGGNIVKDANTLKPTINSAGVYILEINNTTNNCIKEIEKTISIDTLKPLINVSQDLITCANPTTELSGKVFQTNNYSLNWTTTSGTIVSTKTDTLSIVVSKKGIYSLKVKNNSNECENTKDVNVLEDKTLPTTDAGPALEVNCQDSILTLQGDKSSKGVDFTYKWTTIVGNILAGETTLAPKIDKAGAYYLLIVNKGNGCQNKDTVDIKINKTIPQITSIKPDTLTCKKQQVNVKASSTATGTAAFAWTSGANTNIVSSDKTQDNINVNRPGIYSIAVIDDKNKCSSKANITVYQDTIKPTANAGANIELNCKSPTIVIDGIATGNNLAYNWTTTNGTIVANGNQAKVTVKSAGFYKFSVVNTFSGCSASDEMEVTFLGAPTAVIVTPDKLTCTRKTVVLDSKGSDTGANYDYVWSDTNGNTLGATATLNVTKPGVYNFTVINKTNDCEQKKQVTIEEDIVNPTAEAGTGATISCDKGYAVLNANNSSTGAKYAYLWKGGIIESGAKSTTPKVTAQATYTLVVTNTENGCTASDSVAVISLKPAVLASEVKDPLCYNGKGSIAFTTIVGGTPPYSYSINGGQTYSSATLFKNLKPNDYVVKVQDSKGCTDEKLLTINNPEQLTIALAGITKTKIGESIQLNPIVTPTNPPLKSIIWSPDSLLSCKNCINPTVQSPKKSIYLQLKVVNDNGCEAEAYTTVDVDKSISVYVPSSFSPNGDGNNDRFIAFGNPNLVLKIKWMRVYDRWGEMLYEENDINVNDVAKGWDGSFRNEDMNPGVYVWDMQVIFADGSIKILKGDVTLHR